jgi:hypothetical protein
VAADAADIKGSIALGMTICNICEHVACQSVL